MNVVEIVWSLEGRQLLLSFAQSPCSKLHGDLGLFAWVLQMHLPALIKCHLDIVCSNVQVLAGGYMNAPKHPTQLAHSLQ